MTDSMKFGPEWLRNMSADNTNSSLLSSGGITSGGNVMTTSSNSNNGGNGGGHQSFGITSSVSSPAITPFSYALAPRNTFPEFRYGREEMLSLFDKNYNMPEILPTFKKIFVEKVQLPLALTPSTDEELLPQVPPVTTQRPSWMQRSPVGFNTSTRGVGRGGSVDRGRMRGKPNYHQIYQRPTAMFGDDDPRSIPVKAERGWPERNGGGDSLNTGGGNMCGIGGISSDWNGTPTSSPRKEFSSHPRNMENWRRNRNEDGSGDAPSGGLSGTEGWRGNSGTGGNFTATHRWGRSTSWRDEDMATANITDVGYSGGSGHNLTMQRSYSTITTVNERGGYISSSSKAPPNSLNGNQASSRTCNFLSGLNTPLARSGQWNSHSGGIGNSSGGDVEDNLPEWAMENPLEGGGTFDASGAFHGSVDDENENIDKQTRKKSDCSSESSACNNEGSSAKDSKSSETSTGRTSTENEHNKSNVSDSSEHSSPCTPIEGILDLPKEISLETKTTDIAQKPDTSKHVSPQIQQEQTSELCSSDVTPTTVASSNTAFYNTTNKINPNIDGNGNVHRDLSDRMREVTDNMIEKLIMEDDNIDNNVRNEVKQDGSPLPVQVTVVPPNAASNNLCAPNVFTSVAAMLKQPTQQPNESPVSVSPTLTPALTQGLHKGIQLYGGGVVVDHATMQHHHMQQHQLAAAAAANIATVGRPSQNINATTLPTDLWYYRDPQSKVQGPFTAIEMTEWYRAGYFNENLFVRRICDTHFRSLGELIKICNDNMPFTHSHLIPNLDNMHLATSPAVGQTQKPHASGDYSLKQQTHQQAELQQQQQQQRDQLKSHLSPGVEFLSGNVKNLIPVGVSNMYYQMLRHQEMLIYSELSDNECFQQLTPAEKGTVVRQKLQMYVEYLPNRAGLSNSLAAMNHSATTNQLYDIMDGAKKDHMFSDTATGYPNVPQQPPNSFMEHDDFLINTQQHQQPMQTVFNNTTFANVIPTGVETSNSGKLNRGMVEEQAANELLNSFNLRMFLPSKNGEQPLLPSPKAQEFIGSPNADFLNEAQLLAARNSLVQTNPLAHSWLPPVANRAPIGPHQAPNEWSNNLLVGIPMPVAAGCNNTAVNGNNLTQEIQLQPEQHPQKIIPVSMWDLPILESTPSEQIKSQQPVEYEPTNYENHKSSHVPATPSKQEHTYVNDGQPKGSTTTPEKQADAPKEIQQQSSPAVALPTSPITKQLKDEAGGKNQNGSTKRAVKQQTITNKNAKATEDSSSGKKTEEERRRDQAEDKRRQKEEKKRQQADEEKRRQQQIEDEKRRQMLEEKERQQQIQVQRRKAMLGNNANINNSTGLAESVNVGAKLTKENPRIQSSVAPWSAQSNAAFSKGGPCLAEIQKAERRERQMEQRQMEMFVKRVRASAAAAVEAFDSMLKWNAPVKDVPVKSFAEIQAEEAKRLANEQIELQRRKEQEQQQVTAVMGTNSNAGGGPNNISAIWSGTKVWGSTSTTGFWEEPIKFSAAAAANTNAGGGNAVGSSSASNIVSKTSSPGQQKLASSVSASNTAITTSGPVANQQQNAAVRNLRKSQTVSIMQSAGTQNGKSSKNNNQQPSNNAGKPGLTNKTQPQKSTGNTAEGGAGADKRVSTKTQSNNTSSRASATNNKRDDYESEFITWCTKSLNNMNTKLDVPTFVTFLRDLESPYEVRDYIRMYIGENKESTDFGKQFLERRSKYKNLQRAQNAHNDDMCKPAPAITPSGNDNSDNKGKQKKVKKNKMTKLDARILGFSVTAAEGRTNVGDRVYVDAP